MLDQKEAVKTILTMSSHNLGKQIEKNDVILFSSPGLFQYFL